MVEQESHKKNILRKKKSGRKGTPERRYREKEQHCRKEGEEVNLRKGGCKDPGGAKERMGGEGGI